MRRDILADETNLSRLFFTPDRVYKQLKAVDLPFVDFTDREHRLAAAVAEYEANHEIAPDVYLGTADVIEHGVVAERLIVMRRLPADRALDAIIAAGGDQSLRAVARHVATLHADAPPVEGPDADVASVQAVARNWRDNFDAIRPFVDTVIAAADFELAEELTTRYLEGRGSLFQLRIEGGWVRRGHGDLRCEHVYLTDDGPRLIDCLAFREDLRVSDALADVAFLAMDLHRLAGPEAAAQLVRYWDEFTGEHHPSSLAHFYVAYRAHVRCKVELLRAAAGDDQAAYAAAVYHALALDHLRHARVRLVLVGGGPGAGKSTVSRGVAARLGAAWLRSDEIRKDVAGIGHDDHAFADPGAGIYGPEVSSATHDEICRQTELLLSRGVSTVLDATWANAEHRAELRRIAAALGAELSELRCEVEPSIARERIARRMSSVYNPSDATPDLVDYLAARFDPWPEAATLATAQAVDASVEQACRAIEGEPHPAPARFVADIDGLRELTARWLYESQLYRVELGGD